MTDTLEVGQAARMRWSGVHVLPQSNQLRALHTTVRDRDASRDDFVFYSRRIMRMLLEAALDLLPFRPLSVITPVGAIYEGLGFAEKLCAVPVIRAGESMEAELRSMNRDIRIGKILIQRDKTTKQPELLYSHLPSDIKDRYVLLLEPMIATGGSTIRAVNVLTDAGVAEKNIIVVNFLASPDGLDRVAVETPQVRIVTSAVERELNEHAYMVPGIGDFGDRYFGTTDAGARED